MINSNDLRKVRIGCFKGIMEGGHATKYNGVLKQVVNVELNVDTISYITCIIDDEKKVAIDIFTGFCYPMLERDSYDRIIEPENGIVFNAYYALNIENENVKTQSQIYNMYLKYVASKTAIEYQKENNKNSIVKVYKKK